MMKIKFVYFVLVFLFLFSFASAGLYYKLDVSYDSGSYQISKVDVIYSRFEENNVNGTDLSIFLFNDKSLIYKENFKLLGFNYLEDYANQTNDFEFLDKFNASVFVPYYNNADLVVIEDSSGNVLAKKNILSSLNNKIEESVPELPFIDEAELEGSNEESFNYNIVFIILLVLIVLLIVYFVFRKKFS